MLSITRDQLELLIELQENERQALAVKAEIDQMPDKMAALEASLQAWLQDLESVKAGLAALKKDYRSYEAELETQQSRIKKRQVQLHSVKTNREYQGLLKEIDDIKSASSRIEDTSLQCLDDIDKAEKDLGEKNKAFASEQHRIEMQKQELAEEIEKLKHRMDQLLKAASEIENQLDPGLVEQYRQVKKRCGGIGLVQVENAVCKGCFLNIPPQMYNELHKGNELRMCPHCHRLIYVL
jgi:predicted  nucleic acid-binding Zn-ribbon protein